jgi:hypothetical protein
MQATKSTKTIGMPAPLAANIEEIGRHLDDLANGDLQAPRTAALELFIESYVNDYPEAFDEKDDALYVYTGGDSNE